MACLDCKAGFAAGSALADGADQSRVLSVFRPTCNHWDWQVVGAQHGGKGLVGWLRLGAWVRGVAGGLGHFAGSGDLCGSCAG